MVHLHHYLFWTPLKKLSLSISLKMSALPITGLTDQTRTPYLSCFSLRVLTKCLLGFPPISTILVCPCYPIIFSKYCSTVSLSACAIGCGCGVLAAENLYVKL